MGFSWKYDCNGDGLVTETDAAGSLQLVKSLLARTTRLLIVTADPNGFVRPHPVALYIITSATPDILSISSLTLTD